MKAVRIHQYGGPAALLTEQVDVPSITDGTVLVKMVYAGVNFIDVYQRTGLYPVQLPYIPGLEGSGIVEAVGNGIAHIRVGDRVAFASVPGGYAEYTVVPEERLVKVVSDVSLEVAAAVLVQGLTAHYLSHSSYPLKPGVTCLIHAAAGGVGLLLVQIAKHLGARVIATVSTDAKAALAAQAGADHVIIYTQEDFLERTRAITEGRGVDVVYDSVGQATFDKSLAALAVRGHLALFGQASGPVPPFDPLRLGAGSLSISRPRLNDFTATREEYTRRCDDLFSWIRSGILAVQVGRTFTLEEAPEAHRQLESRATIGKVLLKVPGTT